MPKDKSLRRTGRLAFVLFWLLPLDLAFAAEKASAPRPRPANGGSDLTLVLVVAANFYCENLRWPANMDEVLAFRNSRKIRTDLKISEPWLRSPDVRITADSSFRVRARDVLKEQPVIVVATQAVPQCEKDEVTTVEADMKLEPDGEL